MSETHLKQNALATKVPFDLGPIHFVGLEGGNLDPEGSRFDVVFRGHDGEEDRWTDLFLPMAGKHNTQNVLSAIAVARELGLDAEKVRAGLDLISFMCLMFTRREKCRLKACPVLHWPKAYAAMVTAMSP